MNYEELQEIFRTTVKDEWLFNDERGIYTYKNDLNLRIQRREIDFDSDKFQGVNWANKFPNPVAYRTIYEIYYGASFIKEKLLIAVDGFRATLPLPKIGTNFIKSEDYRFAKIVDQSSTLDDYMKIAKLMCEA